MDNVSNFGKIYYQIVNGFTIKDINKKRFYFKHPSVAEHYSLYNNYELILQNATNQGLKTEKDKIEEAIQGGWWSQAKESEINLLKRTIKNLYKTKNKLLLPSQKKSIDIQIRKNESILVTFLKERKEITNLTAEDFTNDKFLDEMLISLTYKDINLQDRFFIDDSFYDLVDSEYEYIKNAYNNCVNLFSMENIKCVAASGFFQNLVYISEDAFSFWGKPASKCTKYQIDVLVYGKMYKNLIKSHNENGKPIPDDITEDPKKFISWVDNLNNTQGKNVQKTSKHSNTNNKVSSFVGATKEDLTQMGIKTEKIKGKNLLDLARDSGGILEKSQYLNARESG